jgi:O-antigen/teichoic acid export membrane protein
MENRNMKQHITFVGALHIGFGILGLLGALTVFIIFNFAQGFVPNEPLAEEILSFLGGTLSLIIMFFAALGIIGGIGLFSYKSWARILVIIVSAINCLNIPVGTAKGVYSIWVLMQKETMELFELS